MRLAAGQRPRVAAKERQVRSEFLAKGHDRSLSIVITIGAVFDDATRLLQPWKDRPIACALPPQRSKSHWNKGLAIWFPCWAGHAARAFQLPRRLRLDVYSGTGHADRDRCAAGSELYEARLDPREGGREVECQEANRVG